MKRMRKIIAAAVTVTVAAFCLLLPVKTLSKQTGQHTGFPDNGKELLSAEKEAFAVTYERITGEELDSFCLISDTAEQFSVRAVWFSYLDWQQYLAASERKVFLQKAKTVLQNCAKLGSDTVILQLRAFGDAFYPSAYYPFSRYFASEEPDFDPLKLFLQTAKEYGVSVAGWVNPFRLDLDEHMKKLTENLPLGALYADEEMHMKQAENGIWWLDPADEKAVKLICDGIRELCGYELSAIWFDDYFYSGVSPKGFGYSESEAKQALNRFMSKIRDTVREEDPSLTVGVSPQGNITVDMIPVSDQKLFTSLADWCEQGYVDCIMPQVYYGMEHETADFETVCARWDKLTQNTDCSLMIALAFYKCGKEDTYAGTGRMEWCENSDVIATQIKALCGKTDGFSLFRYGSIFDPGNSVAKEEYKAVLELLG